MLPAFIPHRGVEFPTERKRIQLLQEFDRSATNAFVLPFVGYENASKLIVPRPLPMDQQPTDDHFVSHDLVEIAHSHHPNVSFFGCIPVRSAQIRIRCTVMNVVVERCFGDCCQRFRISFSCFFESDHERLSACSIVRRNACASSRHSWLFLCGLTSGEIIRCTMYLGCLIGSVDLTMSRDYYLHS